MGEYIDLGLSVKWASCNIGAKEETDCGYYYAWGETEPKETYSWGNYKFAVGSEDENSLLMTKYNMGDIVLLDKLDDVAAVLLGGDCRMPTIGEFEELYRVCNWRWTGHGYIIRSTIQGYRDRSIYLPAANMANNGVGDYGRYWSSSLNGEKSILAKGLGFDSYNQYLRSASRFYGFSVRPVCP